MDLIKETCMMNDTALKGNHTDANQNINQNNVAQKRFFFFFDETSGFYRRS